MVIYTKAERSISGNLWKTVYVEKKFFNLIKLKTNVTFPSECNKYPTDQNDLISVLKWTNCNLIDTISWVNIILSVVLGQAISISGIF